MRRRGILTIPPELLFNILEIKHATLLDARVNQFGNGNLELSIESPDMPECADFEHPQTASLEEIRNALYNRQST